ncbi:hypothetical protein WQ54_25355 [Bacillus sp. SA1-12]|uniref:MerR family transcriptional regulator n=1 Tax=Bacillus sp. SA1-12 TaxID=1455638 RepID=UPI000626FA78|nr:MerR family transcriptional regulator [Bacillus sp. SA1-12]KKI89677.1 hypothetical protein WQ54_25355 [Bacillus sp. SA1-12]
MSTAAAAKALGVSRRTLMRWVHQLDMELEKNELGHYQFNENDLARLKELQEQLNNQPEPHAMTEKSRKGTLINTAVVNEPKVNTLNERMDELERKIRGKADDVVSYQLLQHRREMEDLLNKVQSLEKRVEELEGSHQKRDPMKDHVFAFDQSSEQKKPRRKNFISSIFSF